MLHANPRRRMMTLSGMALLIGMFGAVLVLPRAASAQGTEHMVSITPDGYDPESITITVGDTVTWTNDDPTTPDEAPWAGRRGVGTDQLGLCELVLAAPGLASGGESGSCTFEEEGTYPYSDFLDPDEDERFRGVVIVQGAGQSTPTEEPTETATAEPTGTETAEPTETETAEPSETPTAEPTVTATAEPTVEPTLPEPTPEPTQAEPTEAPPAPTQAPPAPTQAPPTPTQAPPAPPSAGGGLAGAAGSPGATLALAFGIALIVAAGAFGTGAFRQRRENRS
jgi:plastocyanin